MDLTNETFAPLRVFVDELARAGVRHAVVAPGSRNAPIAYVLADEGEIKCWSVLDERQAGFFALGIAKSTGTPVAVTCTSGTAAAGLLPAVIEASHAGVPLVLLTADRPPELRDVGAGQAIDQIKLYGDAVRWFVEAGNHPITDETLRHFRALGARAAATASGTDPGPVHINLPLREPLQPRAQELGEVTDSLGARGRAGGAAWVTLSSGRQIGGDLLETLETAERPLLVVGEQHRQGLAAAIGEIAARAQIPVFADALSQMRRREIAAQAPVVASYDLLLRSETVRHRLVPDLVIRVGDTPTSKPLRSWLAELECRQIVFDPRGRWQDPSRSASDIWQIDPLASFTSAAEVVDSAAERTQWTGEWVELESVAQAAIETELASQPFPFEPAVIRSALANLDDASVFVSSSMPIRDVEAYGPIGSDTVRYLANRGTNGIDGVVSSALGVGAPHSCDRVLLITGDLAFLYDVSALAIAKRHALEITVLCLDNGGGGIFSFLPIAEHDSHFEQLIAAPAAIEIEAITRAYGIDHRSPTRPDELSEALSGSGVIHLRTNRAANKSGHDAVAAAVVAAVDGVSKR